MAAPPLPAYQDHRGLTWMREVSAARDWLAEHATIARFANDHENELADPFDQVLRLAAEIGLVNVGLVALDSTRVHANASPGATRSVGWTRDEVERIVTEARATGEATGSIFRKRHPRRARRSRKPARPAARGQGLARG